MVTNEYSHLDLSNKKGATEIEEFSPISVARLIYYNHPIFRV
jgi:hypothetical protein